MMAQAGAVNGQASCARGEGSVKAAALSTEATTPAVISQGLGRAQATAQSEVQWLQSWTQAGLRWELRARLGGKNVKWHAKPTPPPPPRFI